MSPSRPKANTVDHPYVRSTPSSVQLDLHVVPGSKRRGAQGIHGGRVKFAVTAPPVEGKANEAVIEALSEILSVPKRDISILRGTTDRRKTVEILGISAAILVSKLGL